jgi:outer membrane protein TolC
VRLLALLLPLIWLAGPSPVFAQTGEPRSLALRDAIGMAVRGNPTLLAAGAQVRIAAAGIQAARGLEDFLLEVGARWVETKRELVPGQPVQERSFDELGASLSLIKPIPTGGRIGLGVVGEFSRRQFVTDLGAVPPSPLLADADIDLDMDVGMGALRPDVDEFVPALRLSFAHPLLRGFGVGVARAPRRRAAVEQDVALAERAGTAATLVRDVENAYWDLAYATQELVIRRAAASSAREQLKRVQANIEVGKQPRSASAEVDVAVAFRDESVLFAEQTLAERALELGRLCGLRPRTRSAARLVASDDPQPPQRTVEESAVVQSALDRNPQLLAVRAQGRGAAIEVDVTRNGLLPQLDLAVAGGPTGNASDPRQAYRSLKGLGNYLVTASLVFQQPIGRNAAHGAHTAARESAQRVRLQEDEIADQVVSAVLRGVTAVDTARRRVEVLARSTDAAALDLEAEKARFEVGRSTNFDVLRRQDSLAGAQLTHLRARVDQLKALAFVEALTGEILERHAIAFERSAP